MDPSTANEENLILSGGKYYLRLGATEFTAKLRIAPDYIDDFDTTCVSVTYGGKALEDSDYSVFQTGEDTLDVWVKREYYAKEDDIEPSLRTGNIVVSYKPAPVVSNKSSYAFSVGNGLYIDPEDVENSYGLEYDAKAKKFYVTKDAASFSVKVRLSEGYYYEVPDEGIVANVKIGDKKAKEDNYFVDFDVNDCCFEFNYYFDYNEKADKYNLGNVSFSTTLQSLIKVSLAYDREQLELTNCDPSSCFSSMDNKAFYVKKGEDLEFYVSASDGYRVSDVLKGKETVPCGDVISGEKDSIVTGCYTIKKVTAATTVTAKAAALPGIKLNIIVDDDKNSKNAVVVLKGVDSVTGGLITRNEEVTVEVNPSEGRVISDVSVGSNGYYETLKPEADGTYILTKSKVISWTEIGDPVDILVTTDEEPVNVYVSVNDSPYNNQSIYGLLTFNFESGAIYDRKIHGYQTSNIKTYGRENTGSLKMSINPDSEAVIVESVKYKLGESGKLSNVTRTSEDSDVFTGVIDYELEEAEVQKAKKNHKDIFIEITATKKEPKPVTFNTEGVIFTRYYGEGKFGGQLQGIVEVPYGTEFMFAATLEEYKGKATEIKSVKCGSRELKPIKDDYGQYYSLGKIKDDTPVTIEVEIGGFDCIVVKKGSESTVFRGKASLTMNTDEKATIEVFSKGSLTRIKDIKFINMKKDSHFAYNSSPGIINIDGSYAKGINKKVTLSITCEGESSPRLIDILVMQKPTSMNVSGFKKGKATLPIGTSNVFSVKLDDKCDYRGLAVVLKDDSVSAGVTLDKEAGTLTIDTFKGEALAEENKDITFEFVGGDGEAIGSPFVVTPVKAVIAAPSVKVTDTDDKKAVLSLALPKGAEGYRNLQYYIEAVAITDKKNPTVPEGMKSKVTLKVPVSDTKAVLVFSDSKTGSAVNYRIAVKLVQYRGEEVFAAGKEKTVKAATKAPCYETKLSLVKKQTAFTVFEKDVVLATGKYSKTTTYKELVKAEIFAKGSNTVVASSADGTVSVKNNTVMIKDTGLFTPGKYVLKVYPASAEGEGKPATLNFVAKAPVTNISLTPNCGRLYKQSKKAATLKLSASCVSTKASDGKPSSSKLTWMVSSENEELLKAIRIKNGTVTVDKSYDLTGDRKKDSFTVTATATDLDVSNPMLASSKVTILVTSEMIKPAAVSITGIDSLKAPVALGTVNGSKLVVTDSDGRAMDLSLVTITVAPKAGLTVTADGIIRVTRKGTYTITVTANDGSKNKIKQKIKIN
jgi:hypothetical protein